MEELKTLIKISDEVKEYLDELLHDNGAEAWYTAQIKLDLYDYNGAIKQLANDLCFARCLNDDKLSLANMPFKNTIRVREK